MGGSRKLSGCFALLLSLIFQVSNLDGADTIRHGESMRDGQTLVSPGNRFELGFFSPPSSKNRYVGIWFKQVTVPAIVWVGNRENYLNDKSGILTINDGGNLMIRDGSGKSIMLTSVSAPSTNSSSATLLDNGNFILKNEEGEVWQSFDHPTDTLLSGMKVRVGLKMERKWSLVSWKSPEDPAPGSYSLEADIDGAFHFLIREQGDIYWSSGAWNGVFLSLTPEMKRGFTHRLTFVANGDEIIMTYTVTDSRTLSRFMLDSSGQIQHWRWIEDGQYWDLIWAQPRDDCDRYNACSSNARCNIAASVHCSCLQGFYLSDGQSNRSSGRCVRRKSLRCDDEDRFYPLKNIKFPDRSLYEPYPNLGVKHCEARCRSNCSCTAYASAYSNGTGGCLFWSGDLIGLRDDPLYNNGDGFAAGNLYIRLDGSDIGAKNNSRKKRKIGVIIGVVASGVVLGFLLCYLLRRKLKSKGKTDTAEVALSFQPGNTESTVNNESYLGQGQANGPNPPFFSFATIETATDNFALGNKLGQGGFGPVYKGKLPDGQEIAVKRLSRSSGQGLEEFKNEVLLTSKLQHKNLVRLLGWSVHDEEKILIYEYMPNKSLDSFLFEQSKKSVLDWGKRMQIIEGIAQGLLYLHRYSRLRIIHRDLKASNILLDSDMNPKISDFGMARMFDGNQSEANTKRVVGTYGYMSPEYAMRGVFSMKSDVFSFGVLLLEIVGGKKNTSFHQSSGPLNLLGYAWELWREGRSLELVDPMLVDSSPKSEILRYFQVALLCVQDSPVDRPTMSEVVHMPTDITATIAVPKHPAFFIRRVAEAKTSSSRPPTGSINYLTVSEIEGR